MPYTAEFEATREALFLFSGRKRRSHTTPLPLACGYPPLPPLPGGNAKAPRREAPEASGGKLQDIQYTQGVMRLGATRMQTMVWDEVVADARQSTGRKGSVLGQGVSKYSTVVPICRPLLHN